MSKYVSFEISKLLKEKGFDVITQYCFHSDDNRIVFVPYNEENLNLEQTYEGEGLGVSHTSRPHISDVVDWLNEKFGIWIYNTCDVDGNFYPHIYFSTESNWQNLELRSKMNEGNRVIARNDYKSPQEAYLGTIKYVLKHMI